ncbi:MAG: DUF1722 domain-containing protein [Pseudomonadales bacterium]|nr:DUF1722 domain-containing protein [Pseudomonadales bacterium]
MLTPKVGISRCLLGAEVRYDGTGAKASMPHSKLAGLFNYADVCPEVAIGMSVPREPIRVIRDLDVVRVVGAVEGTQDYTPALSQQAKEFIDDNRDLSGFIFMHNSPSCGTRNVKVYPTDGGPAVRNGQGVFAATVAQLWPALPCEDGGRLFEDALRENFVTRVFAFAEWQKVAPDLSAKAFIAFHSRYKYLLMAHSTPAYKEAGRLLSDLRGSDLHSDLEEIGATYIEILMRGLQNIATRGGHANVLAHIQGYLKKHLSRTARQELAGLIDAYRKGEQPLLAPVALLKHHFREHPNEYVEMQAYLEPRR